MEEKLLSDNRAESLRNRAPVLEKFLQFFDPEIGQDDAVPIERGSPGLA